jgi:ethanolamine utilization protein EutQ (cupin superfamily)
MTVRKFSIADASFERSPGQDGEVFAGNLIDQRHGGPITLGYGRYGPHQSIDETLAVHDVMVVLEGSLLVTSQCPATSRIASSGTSKSVWRSWSAT